MLDQQKSQQVRLDQQAVQEAKKTLSFDDGMQQKRKERIKYIIRCRRRQVGSR
jgi:hypothetical protein